MVSSMDVLHVCTHIHTKVQFVCHIYTLVSICSNLQGPISSAQYPSLTVTTGRSIWPSHDHEHGQMWESVGSCSIGICSCKNSPQPSAVHCTFASARTSESICFSTVTIVYRLARVLNPLPSCPEFGFWYDQNFTMN